jgi:hypothetical protein
MSLATEQGKEYAIAQLKYRREHKPEPIDNSKLPAYSPMYFPCISCGAYISVPENYLIRPQLCRECQALKDLGWLNQ